MAPILQQHCVKCHRPGAEKGDISLTTIDDLQAAGAIDPGGADDSYLMELISNPSGGTPQMPKDNPPLSTGQVELIRKWIDAGR